jgi:hypothetical protein
MSDATIAMIARRLAFAYSRSGYERSDEAAKEIALLKTELCAAVRAETPEGKSVECPVCHWGFAPSVIDQHMREKH